MDATRPRTAPMPITKVSKRNSPKICTSLVARQVSVLVVRLKNRENPYNERCFGREKEKKRVVA